ncbi:cytochrome P450 [Aspergillus indologenus CBS 114.80]|uniref:Cytochrome P450 n=1 Tax=Aspergillus indologenus CBS 114.80 TaxID=1450541 RepID=A0A2V5J134_9EURO|nr:cytochrome P450 [Aspergillus indologenus CBS 114.80]
MDVPAAALGHRCLFGAVLLLCLLLSCAVYRVFFHPLAKFPGPRLAAVSSLWELYHDLADGGAVHSYPELHRKYSSPVIRTGPNTLHLAGPYLHDEIYNSKNNILKHHDFYERIGFKYSLVGLANPAKAKAIRAALGPFFSHRSVSAHYDSIRSKLACLRQAVQSHWETGEPVELQTTFARLTCDMTSITSLDFDPMFSESYTESADLLEDLDKFAKLMPLFRHIPFLSQILLLLPEGLVAKLGSGYIRFRQTSMHIAQRASLSSDDSTSEKQGTIAHKVFAAYRQDPELDRLPTSSLVPRLAEEIFGLLVAGSHTTALTLTETMFYLLKHPACLDRLREELDGACHPSDGQDQTVTIDFDQVRQLPYLLAVVNESIRMASASAHPLPRITPPEGVRLGEHLIPGNTIIGASAICVHMDKEIFPDPESFRPERWLVKDNGEDLSRWLVSFSKGSRRCIGISLAMAEVQLALATFVVNFDFQLVGPTSATIPWADSVLKRHLEPVMVAVTGVRHRQ